MAAPHSHASPPTVLGRLLYLVYDLYLAFFCVDDHGGVVGTNDMLAVQLLQGVEVCSASSTLSYSPA